MVERFKEVAMGRTRAELAARLREGFEANNFAPVLEVIAELEAPEAAPVPEPNEWDVPPADMVEEHDDEAEGHPDVDRSHLPIPARIEINPYQPLALSHRFLRTGRAASSDAVEAACLHVH